MKEKNGRELLFLLISILGALFLLSTILALYKANPIVGVITIIPTIIEIKAFIAIYNKECEEYFN